MSNEKPREFWIRDDGNWHLSAFTSEIKLCQSTSQDAFAWTQVHVIEYSAYEKSQQELTEAEAKIKELEKLNSIQRESIWQVIFGEPELMDKVVYTEHVKQLQTALKVAEARLEKCKEQRNRTIERYYHAIEPSSSAHRSFGIDQKKSKYNGELAAITAESIKEWE